MTDMDEDSTMACSDDVPETAALDMDPINNGLPSESPLEPFEGMEFTSIEEARNHYKRYAKNKGFTFRMGRVTKSRTDGMIIGKEFLCSKEGFRAKKYAK
jgi:hypothetical protein